MESAHRGRMPADQASSSSSVAPDQRDVARACERACGVPCNLRVARQRARQHNAAMEGAVGIAQQEAAEWAHCMAIHASTVAAIAAGLTAAAAHEAATAQVKGEVAATAEEARLTQEAIACKEAEVKALEEALVKRVQRDRDSPLKSPRSAAERKRRMATSYDFQRSAWPQSLAVLLLLARFFIIIFIKFRIYRVILDRVDMCP